MKKSVAEYCKAFKNVPYTYYQWFRNEMGSYMCKCLASASNKSNVLGQKLKSNQQRQGEGLGWQSAMAPGQAMLNS